MLLQNQWRPRQQLLSEPRSEVTNLCGQMTWIDEELGRKLRVPENRWRLTHWELEEIKLKDRKEEWVEFRSAQRHSIAGDSPFMAKLLRSRHEDLVSQAYEQPLLVGLRRITDWRAHRVFQERKLHDACLKRTRRVKDLDQLFATHIASFDANSEAEAEESISNAEFQLRISQSAVVSKAEALQWIEREMRVVLQDAVEALSSREDLLIQLENYLMLEIEDLHTNVRSISGSSAKPAAPSSQQPLSSMERIIALGFEMLSASQELTDWIRIDASLKESLGAASNMQTTVISKQSVWEHLIMQEAENLRNNAALVKCCKQCVSYWQQKLDSEAFVREDEPTSITDPRRHIRKHEEYGEAAGKLTSKLESCIVTQRIAYAEFLSGEMCKQFDEQQSGKSIHRLYPHQSLFSSSQTCSRIYTRFPSDRLFYYDHESLIQS